MGKVCVGTKNLLRIQLLLLSDISHSILFKCSQLIHNHIFIGWRTFTIECNEEINKNKMLIWMFWLEGEVK